MAPMASNVRQLAVLMTIVTTAAFRSQTRATRGPLPVSPCGSGPRAVQVCRPGRRTGYYQADDGLRGRCHAVIRQERTRHAPRADLRGAAARREDDALRLPAGGRGSAEIVVGA